MSATRKQIQHYLSMAKEASFEQQLEEVRACMERIDWSAPAPQAVPELPHFDGSRWVGSFSDSWGEGR